jgi:hypothetical protein
MNERVKELAKQSGVVYDWDPGTSGPEVYFDRQEDFEKFAELVARECMTICEETQATYCKHREFAYDFQDKNIYAEGEAAINIIKYKIKQHFGVEE